MCENIISKMADLFNGMRSVRLYQKSLATVEAA